MDLKPHEIAAQYWKNKINKAESTQQGTEMARSYHFIPFCIGNCKFLETGDPFNIFLTMCHK